MMMRTGKIWEDILEQLRAIPHNNCSDVRVPATESEIASLEEALGVSLPASFREYLSVMNGQKSQYDNPLIGYMNFLDISQIITRRSGMVSDADGEMITWKTEDRIKPVVWDRGWIPFTSNMGGNNMMVVDMAPGQNGVVGQVFLWHPGMGEEDEIAADSFEECSQGLFSRLVNQKYSVDDMGTIEFDDDYFA
jgi:cell wall assembly regulator SMI1